MGEVVTASRGEVFAGYNELEVTVCTCGVLFAVPEKLLDQRRFDGQSFYCPNGHSLAFNGERRRLERDLENARARAGRLASNLEQTEASRRAYQGAATRARRQRDEDRAKIAAGVCPCCDHEFADLAAHMAAEHPGYGPLGEEDAERG